MVKSSLLVLVAALALATISIGCSGSRPDTASTGDPQVDAMKRKIQWNLRVIEHLEQMQKDGKSFDEIESYQKANIDKPPKDFKVDD
jgi:hypothetical protein